jgi:hypothetical protein
MNFSNTRLDYNSCVCELAGKITGPKTPCLFVFYSGSKKRKLLRPADLAIYIALSALRIKESPSSPPSEYRLIPILGVVEWYNKSGH